METNKFIIVCDEYKGLCGKAVNLIYGQIKEFVEYEPEVIISADFAEEKYAEENIIVVGKMYGGGYAQKICSEIGNSFERKEQGYVIQVFNVGGTQKRQMILIAGYDDAGILHGAAAFCNKYCSSIIYKNEKWDMMSGKYFSEPMNRPLPEWTINESPAIKTRGIWTWGHVIFDYRNFFKNMALLRLNEIVIWNDYLPLNADEIVDCAHSWGIKVIWGFAWGWDTDCSTSVNLDEKSLNELKARVIEKYEKEYANAKGDGIYFQTFTELSGEYINGKLIAEYAVNFVNDTAGALLKKYPSLKIQFGLHADSVSKRLEIIKKVDPRISIIWENFGGFPYQGYWGDLLFDCETGDFKKAVDLTEKTVSLREKDEKYGVVLKGMTSLDWGAFIHQTGRFVLGECSSEYIKKRKEEKRKAWKLRQALWVNHSDMAVEIVSKIAQENKNASVYGLVECGAFEAEISSPPAILAEILWNPQRKAADVVKEVLKYSCVAE